MRPDSRQHRLTAGGQRRPLALTLACLMLLVAAAWWSLTPEGASAHANLASADPAPNSELDTAPDRIIIWFTEPIEPALSSIRVLDAAGQQVDEGNSVVDDLNPLVMSVGVGDIPDGTYTVAWSNVSTIDGHRVRGSFLFAVGQPLSGDARGGGGAALGTVALRPAPALAGVPGHPRHGGRHCAGTAGDSPRAPGQPRYRRAAGRRGQTVGAFRQGHSGRLSRCSSPRRWGNCCCWPP